MGREGGIGYTRVMMRRVRVSECGIRRVVALLAACVVLGLVSTAVTTVTAVRYVDPYGFHPDRSMVQLSTPTDTPGRVLRSMVHHASVIGGRLYDIHAVDEVAVGERRDLAPPILRSDLPAWVGSPASENRGVSSVGLGEPFVCAVWSKSYSKYGLSPMRAEPMPRPIWSGVALTTMMWAGAWCALFLGVRAVRRVRRVGHGACAACGYDLRGGVGAVCPECGMGHGRIDLRSARV